MWNVDGRASRDFIRVMNEVKFTEKPKNTHNIISLFCQNTQKSRTDQMLIKSVCAHTLKIWNQILLEGCEVEIYKHVFFTIFGLQLRKKDSISRIRSCKYDKTILSRRERCLKLNPSREVNRWTEKKNQRKYFHMLSRVRIVQKLKTSP